MNECLSKSRCRLRDWWHEIVDDKHPNWSVNEYVAAIEACLDKDVQRDLNKLDSRGTTALHKAIELKNIRARIAAIEGLLKCGADINVTDSRGKTALACLPAVINEVCAIYLMVRINVLAHLDLPICEQNRQWYHQWHDNLYVAWTFSWEKENSFLGEIKKYALYGMIVNESTNEIKALRETPINNQTTLAQVLNEMSDEQIICQLDDLRAVVVSNDFYEKFIDFGGLIKQRYRKALRTRNIRLKKLKPFAMRAVDILFQLPDLCNELVVDYLSYNDVLSLLEAFRFCRSQDVDKVPETTDYKQSNDPDLVYEAIGRLFS